MIGVSYFGRQHSQIPARIAAFGELAKSAPLEVFSDPLVSTRGVDRDALIQLSKSHLIFLQGKGLSLGSTDPIDMNYLVSLKQLAKEVNAQSVGDFLAWTGVAGRHIHALMPVVYNSAMLKHLVERVRMVQDFLECPLLIENTLVPVSFKSNEMTEAEFFAELCLQSGAQISLNISHLFLNSKFRNFDADLAFKDFPFSSLKQLKIAPIDEKKSWPFALSKEEWDRNIWSILSLSLKNSGKYTKAFPLIFVRDEDASGGELSAYLKWASLLSKEFASGLKKSSADAASISL